MANPKIPAFPFPFDYCSLDRAARLFDCEVDDIWHLVKVGAVRLYVDTELLYFSEPRRKTLFLKGQEIYVNNQFTDVKGVDYSYENIWLELIPKLVKQSNPFKKFQTYKGGVMPNGFWSIDYDSLDSFKDGEPFPVYSLKSYSGHIQIHSSDPVRVYMIDLVIIRPDLELIHAHIHNGEPMPSYINGGKIRPTENKVHGHTTSAKERKLLLIELAASVLKKYPKTNIKSYTDFTRAILRHANEFPQLGQLDLGEQSIRKKLPKDRMLEKILTKSNE